MPSSRCAVHPSRPAASRCPRCDRLRCDADAAALPDACLACTTVDRHPVPAGARRTAGAPLEALVRGGAVAVAVAGLAALVCSQYVDAGLYAYVTPALAGIVCGVAVQRAAGAAGTADSALRVLAVVAALAAVAGSFRLVPGGLSVVTPLDRVALPYVLAVAGAWLATAPPGGRRASRRDGATAPDAAP